MKILLIAPASGKWRHVGKRRLFKGKAFRFSLLGLLAVAAETPSEHQVEIIDEQIEDIPFDADVDLVGIGFMTALAPRAYEISAQFRARGVPVVFGGYHSTLCTEDALEHCDAVVKGDVEGVWQHVLDDVIAGTLSDVYQRQVPPANWSENPLPRHLLKPEQYATIYATQATRGCPHQCAFCSVSAYHGGQIRKRPAEQVAAEVASIPDRMFLFVDDNLTADRDYALELCRALAPLNKLWVTQSTLSVADDTELVNALSDAGCYGLFVGMESFKQENLEGTDKGFNRVASYREQIATLHRAGIAVEAGIVLGFPKDDPTVFATTLHILDELEIDMIQASIFTPLPGTPLHEKLSKQQALDPDWGHYDFHTPVFTPKGMTKEQLQAGHDWVTSQFYTPGRIATRMARHFRRPRGRETWKYIAALNVAYYGRTRSWGMRGHDPAASGYGVRMNAGEALAASC